MFWLQTCPSWRRCQPSRSRIKEGSPQPMFDSELATFIATINATSILFQPGIWTIQVSPLRYPTPAWTKFPIPIAKETQTNTRLVYTSSRTPNKHAVLLHQALWRTSCEYVQTSHSRSPLASRLFTDVLWGMQVAVSSSTSMARDERRGDSGLDVSAASSSIGE